MYMIYIYVLNVHVCDAVVLHEDAKLTQLAGEEFPY